MDLIGHEQRFDALWDGRLLAADAAALRRAIARGELRVHYQPLVNLVTGRVAGVEALARWQHPDLGLLPPSAFIPLAEGAGLIGAVGRWTLTEACGQAARWRNLLPDAPPLVMSVNLSARQCREASIVREVARTLDATGLSPERLQLEITESTALEDSPVTRAAIRGLRALGARVVLDDFGAGYSALASLKCFAIDGFKIDRTFVAGLGRERVDTALVRALIELGLALGLSVTAEGVETDAQGARLRALGCALGQGYQFGRPLPPGETTALLARGDLPANLGPGRRRPPTYRRAGSAVVRAEADRGDRVLSPAAI